MCNYKEKIWEMKTFTMYVDDFVLLKMCKAYPFYRLKHTRYSTILKIIFSLKIKFLIFTLMPDLACPPRWEPFHLCWPRNRGWTCLFIELNISISSPNQIHRKEYIWSYCTYKRTVLNIIQSSIHVWPYWSQMCLINLEYRLKCLINA